MKFVTKKVIKGLPYNYIQYEGLSKSLGLFLPDNLKKMMLDFFYDVGEKKFNKLDPSIKRQFPFSNLGVLEKSRFINICISENELFAREYSVIMQWFTILFTYNSNRAEGSKVTRPEIEKLAFSRKRKLKTRTDREIYNSFLALEYAFSDRMKWNFKSIKKIHTLLLDGLDDFEILGKWKNENNLAPGDQPTTNYENVHEEMKKLIKWVKAEFKKNTYPPLLAIQFYCRFERIHPFLDGNGRVGRILLNIILFKYKYIPVIFYTKNHKEHCEGIKQALEGRSAKIKKHFVEQAAKTYKELLAIVKLP